MNLEDMNNRNKRLYPYAPMDLSYLLIYYNKEIHDIPYVDMRHHLESVNAPPPKMSNFIPATLAEIYKLISASESKQCPPGFHPNFPFETLLQ